MLQRLEELEAAVRSLQAAIAEQAGLEKRVEELERCAAWTGPQKAQNDLKEPAPQDVGDCQGKTCKGEEPEPSDLEDCRGKTCTGEEPRAALEYSLGETVWDSCAIIGLPEVGWCSSVLLFVNLLLNMFVQGYLSGVLLANPTFRRNRLFKSMLPDLQRWRLSSGHSYRELDASGSTLAARVCNADAALSVAGSQMSLLGEINAYLNLDNGSSSTGGQFVCMVCLFLFFALILQELRSALMTAFAFIQLPRGSSTRMEGGKFMTLSFSRLLTVLLISAARITIAVVLLRAGVDWLSSTSSTTELIFNAAALGFIMDLDELLFQTTVPAHVQNLVGHLAPLTVRRPPLDVEALLPLLAACVGVTSCMYALVIPNIEDMKAVKEVLCGGELNFVVATNPVGFAISRNTTPFARAPQKETIEQLAVLELRDHPPGSALFSANYYHERLFNLEKDVSLKAFAEGSFCHDLDTHRNGEFIHYAPSWFMSVRHWTGLNSGLTLEEQPWTCADHTRFCDKVAVLRTLCPITCGCADAISGLFLQGTVHGCPLSCESEREQRLNNFSCVDLDVTNMSGWVRYWREHTEFLNSVPALSQEATSNFSQKKVKEGCANRDAGLAGTDYCNKEHIFHSDQGTGTIVGFCPATCCSVTEPPPDCPADCHAAGSG